MQLSTSGSSEKECSWTIARIACGTITPYDPSPEKVCTRERSTAGMLSKPITPTLQSSDQNANEQLTAQPNWLSLDPEVMVKVAACLSTSYEKAALRLTCKQWKWSMDQAVKEVPMVLESERPWGQMVPLERIARVCRTFPSVIHLDLTATVGWDSSHLREAKFLRGLDLNAEFPQAFPQLQAMGHIQDLQIINVFKAYPEGRCIVHPDSLDILCRLSALTCLAFWRVDFGPYTGDSLLSRLTCLQELSFSYCRIPDLLKGEPFPRQLRRLDLRGCHLGPYPLHLPTQLCTLDLSGTDVSSQDLRLQIARLNSLRDLRVYIHDDKKVKGPDFLGHLANLTRLEMDRTCCPAHAERLRISSLVQLRHLDVDCSWLTDGASSQLSRLRQLTHLRLRDANWGCLTVADYQKASSELAKDLRRCSLSFLATLDKLKVLNLYHFECLDEAWMAIVTQLTGLQDLNLGCAPEKIAAGLPQLSCLQSLTCLSLEWNNWLKDEDLEFLPHLTALQSLSIPNCMLLGAKSFRRLIGLFELRRLDISNLECGLEGLRALNSGGVTPRLSELVISGCVSSYGGLAEGMEDDVLSVLGSALAYPGSRLTKIVCEDLLFLHATRGLDADYRPLLIDFYQDRVIPRATKLAFIEALGHLEGSVGVCKIHGTRADQKILRYSVDDRQMSDWSFAGLQL